MSKPQEKVTYRVISRLEIVLPPRAGQKSPVFQITWEFAGHVPRLLWIPKDEWSEIKEDEKIKAEIARIQGRTPAAVR